MNNLILQGAALTVAAGAAYLVYTQFLAPADKMGCLESKPEAEGAPVRRSPRPPAEIIRGRADAARHFGASMQELHPGNSPTTGSNASFATHPFKTSTATEQARTQSFPQTSFSMTAAALAGDLVPPFAPRHRLLFLLLPPHPTHGRFRIYSFQRALQGS